MGGVGRESRCRDRLPRCREVILCRLGANEMNACASGFTHFLASGLGANPPMSLGLRKQQRWWIGPVFVPISSLPPICGPEPEMEYRTSQAAWETHVSAIMTAEPERCHRLFSSTEGLLRSACATDPIATSQCGDEAPKPLGTRVA